MAYPKHADLRITSNRIEHRAAQIVLIPPWLKRRMQPSAGYPDRGAGGRACDIQYGF